MVNVTNIDDVRLPVAGTTTDDGNELGTMIESLWNPVVPEGMNEDDDFWNDSWLVILCGDMKDQRRRVTDWVQATGIFTVAPRFVNPEATLLTVNSPAGDLVIEVEDASIFTAGSLLTADAILGALVVDVVDASIFRVGTAVIWDNTPASEMVLITNVDETINQLTLAGPGITWAAGYLVANDAVISMQSDAYIWDDAGAEAVTILGVDTILNQLTIAPPGIIAALGYNLVDNAAISRSPTILDGTHFRLEAVAKTEDTGLHTNPRRYEKIHGFASAVVARVGAVATPLWEVALAAVYPVAGRTAGMITTIYELHLENSTGAAVTAWLEDDAGNAITPLYHIATLDTIVIDWPAGFTRGDAEVYINASVNDVVAQIFGTQE